MAIDAFELNVTLSTTPASALDKIADVFDRQYRGDRGTAETLVEFLHRKVEEFIRDTYISRQIQDERAGAERNLLKAHTAAVKIREKKNQVDEIPPDLDAPQPVVVTGRRTTRKRR